MNEISLLKKELFDRIKDHYISLANPQLLEEMEERSKIDVITNYNPHDTERNFAQLVFHQLCNFSSTSDEKSRLIAALFLVVFLQDVAFFKMLQPQLARLGNEKKDLFNHVSFQGYFLLHQKQRPEPYGYKSNPEIIDLLCKNGLNVNARLGNTGQYILLIVAELLTEAQKRLEEKLSSDSVQAAQKDADYYKQVIRSIVPYCDSNQMQETLSNGAISGEVKKLVQNSKH